MDTNILHKNQRNGLNKAHSDTHQHNTSSIDRVGSQDNPIELSDDKDCVTTSQSTPTTPNSTRILPPVTRAIVLTHQTSTASRSLPVVKSPFHPDLSKYAAPSIAGVQGVVKDKSTQLQLRPAILFTSGGSQRLTCTNISSTQIPSISITAPNNTPEPGPESMSKAQATSISDPPRQSDETKQHQTHFNKNNSAEIRPNQSNASSIYSHTDRSVIIASANSIPNTSKQEVGVKYEDKRNHKIVNERIPQQRVSHCDGWVKSVHGNLDTKSLSSPNVTASPTRSNTSDDLHSNATASTMNAVAGSSPSAMQKKGYDSRVTIASTSSKCTIKARAEQSSNTTPSLSSARSISALGIDTARGQSSDTVANIPIVDINESNVSNTNSPSTVSTTRSIVAGVRMKSRPKKKGPMLSPSTTPPLPQLEHNNHKNNISEIIETTNNPKPKGSGSVNEGNEPDNQIRKIQQQNLDTANSPKSTIYFSWDTYLSLVPATVAPKEAFNQPIVYPENNFKPNMKLEVRDPRNSFGWGLASVIRIEGLFLRLRFDSTDKSNDIYELIDSEKIRAIGSTGEPLLAPVNFTGNIASYSRFVEKVLSQPETIIAPPECFPPKPAGPKKNLFEVGMKLEAVDLKNPDFVCPATIAQVEGNTVKIVFDGWRGSFDYSCDFRSRKLFPINWCRDTGHYILPPNGWESLVKSKGQAGLLAPGTSNSSLVKPVKQSSSSSNQRTPPTPRASQKNYSTKLSKGTTPAKKLKHKITKSSSSSISPTRLSPDRHSAPRPSSKKTMTTDICERNLSNLSHESISPDSASCGLANSVVSNDDQSALNPPPPFQCSRSMPYTEWKTYSMVSDNYLEQQRKKSQNQLLHGENSEINNHLIENGDDNEEVEREELVIANSSFSKTVLSSTPSSSDSPTSSNPKKFKPQTDTNFGFMDRVSELMESKPTKIADWTVTDIVDLISTDEGLARFSNIFIENEIDGKAFILLTKDILLKHMGFKIGPYLKIVDLIDRVRMLK